MSQFEYYDNPNFFGQNTCSIDDMMVEQFSDDQALYYEDFSSGMTADFEHCQEYSHESSITVSGPSPHYAHSYAHDPYARDPYAYAPYANNAKNATYSPYAYEHGNKKGCVTDPASVSVALSAGMGGVEGAGVNASADLDIHAGTGNDNRIPVGSATLGVLSVLEFLNSRDGLLFEYADAQGQGQWAVQLLRGGILCSLLLALHTDPPPYNHDYSDSYMPQGQGQAQGQAGQVWVVCRCVEGEPSLCDQLCSELRQYLSDTPSSAFSAPSSTAPSSSSIPVSNLSFYSAEARLPLLNLLISRAAWDDGDSNSTLKSTNTSTSDMHQQRASTQLQAVQSLNELAADSSLLQLLHTRGAAQALARAFCDHLDTSSDSAHKAHKDTGAVCGPSPSPALACAPLSQRLRTYALLALASLSAYPPCLQSLLQSEPLLKEVLLLCNEGHGSASDSANDYTSDYDYASSSDYASTPTYASGSDYAGVAYADDVGNDCSAATGMQGMGMDIGGVDMDMDMQGMGGMGVGVSGGAFDRLERHWQRRQCSSIVRRLIVLAKEGQGQESNGLSSNGMTKGAGKGAGKGVEADGFDTDMGGCAMADLARRVRALHYDHPHDRAASPSMAING